MKDQQMHSKSTYDEQVACHLVIDTNEFTSESATRVPRNVQIFLAQKAAKIFDHNVDVLKVEEVARYDAFCDDFGPMNAVSIIRFIQSVDKSLQAMFGRRKNMLVIEAEEGPRALTNAVFLVGAYIILRLQQTWQTAAKCLDMFDPDRLEPFRDASFNTADFGLSVQDCWQGLERGRSKGWIDHPSAGHNLWGQIDPDAYEHYDNPMNADLHEIIPGKLLVFRGPKHLHHNDFQDNFHDGEFTHRDFSPQYYLDILHHLGVSSIIQTDQAQYDPTVFTEGGITHISLQADESANPPPKAVTHFFKLVDEARGAVAVHGRAGLGCAGTLAALYLMRSHGFAAREAIAWVRMMRPGSVIGGQQHYLVRIEHSVRRLVAALAATDPSQHQGGGGGGGTVGGVTVPHALLATAAAEILRADSPR